MKIRSIQKAYQLAATLFGAQEGDFFTSHYLEAEIEEAKYIL